MWILYACGSAFFAGVTAILAKCGIRQTDSDVATAIRTIVVLAASWLMVFVTGAQNGLGALTPHTLLFLVLSGLATGASWLCYFRALQLGDVNKVVPIDKSSTILTILLSFLILRESVSFFRIAGMVALGAGTLLMIETPLPFRKGARQKTSAPSSPEGDARRTGNSVDQTHCKSSEALLPHKNLSHQAKKEQPDAARAGSSLRVSSSAWLLYAVLSAVFASLTSILAKIGISHIDSNLGTAIRTSVVLLMAWLIVLLRGKQALLRGIPRSELTFILLSGLATGASWLCYYHALQDGPASVVVPIDKLSILVTVAFSGMFLHETLTRRGALGLGLMTAGTLLMLF